MKDGKKEFAFEDDIQEENKSVSDLARVSQLLLDNRFKRRKTNLHQRMMSAITTLDVLAQIYDIDFIKLWVSNYCEYLTSEGGQGRKDIVDITKFSIERENAFRTNMAELMGKR